MNAETSTELNSKPDKIADRSADRHADQSEENTVRIRLSKNWMSDRTQMSRFLYRQFSKNGLHSDPADLRNLDALADRLSEISEPMEFLASEEDLSAVREDPFARRVLRVLEDAAEDNPTIRLIRV